MMYSVNKQQQTLAWIQSDRRSSNSFYHYTGPVQPLAQLLKRVWSQLEQENKVIGSDFIHLKLKRESSAVKFQCQAVAVSPNE